MKDQLLRSVAEMENLRRRTEKEIRDAKQFSVTGFARDMLAVADNLRRGTREPFPKKNAPMPRAL